MVQIFYNFSQKEREMFHKAMLLAMISRYGEKKVAGKKL
jgi:hypothetical protein